VFNPLTGKVFAQVPDCSKVELDQALLLRDQHADELMNIPGAVGTGIGLDDHHEIAIQVYVRKLTSEVIGAAPAWIDNTRVVVVETGDFFARQMSDRQSA